MCFDVQDISPCKHLKHKHTNVFVVVCTFDFGGRGIFTTTEKYLTVHGLSQSTHRVIVKTSTVMGPSDSQPQQQETHPSVTQPYLTNYV